MLPGRSEVASQVKVCRKRISGKGATNAETPRQEQVWLVQGTVRLELECASGGWEGGMGIW